MTIAFDIDQAIGFTIPARHVRGRIVRLGPTLDAILSAHAYPPPIERLLGQALVMAALLGSSLKQVDGQLTMQAQTENGVVTLLVADYKGGAVRGYVDFDADRLAELGADPTLFGLFGKGYLAITFDQAAPAKGEDGRAERYQGIVPLEGESLGKAAEQYFSQSEQIPSFVQIATHHGDARDGAVAGCMATGILLQHLPEGEVGRERLHVRHDHPEWAHVQALAATLKDSELTDGSLPLADIVWRLFHEEGEVRVLEPVPIAKGCRCDLAHIRDVIGRFPVAEREDMADADGLIKVDCAFCSRIFPLSLVSFVH